MKKKTSEANKTADANGDVRTEPYASSLKVKLTPEEVADRANQAAHVLKDRDAKEDDMKAQHKHAKSVIEELEGRMRMLSEEVRSESTYRLTDCERRYDYGEGTYSEVRLDTGETIHSRPMTEQEKQRELPFEAS